MANRRKPRSGVLLLIVLSLLVLFLLIGMSFLVSAGQFNRLAKSAGRTETTGMPGNKLADSVLYQILRGTRNPRSSLQSHSLLEDLYGRDYFIGQSPGDAVDFGSGHQMQVLTLVPSTSGGPLNNGLGAPLYEDVQNSRFQELQDDYYAGSVVTFLNGTAKGQSTRVLRYKPSQRNMVFEGVFPIPARTEIEKANNEPLRFIINGRQFNGTGAGYNYLVGSMSQSVTLPDSTRVPIALLPHYSSYRRIAQSPTFAIPLDTHLPDPANPGAAQNAQTYGYGGLDEPWDAIDYQNMFLARTVRTIQANEATRALLAVQNGDLTVDTDEQAMLQYLANTGGSIPSFHRPWLIQYLRQRLSGAEPELLNQVMRAVMMRPSVVDHPNFTGSNPAFDPVFGPWDVDNTGEGIPDSNWVDAGLSPVSGPDGRMYKPLVAAHIIDMASRLNINAADGLERTKAKAALKGDFVSSSTVVGPNVAAALPTGENQIGSGYGPADIDVSELNRFFRSRYAGFPKQIGSSNAEVVVNATSAGDPTYTYDKNNLDATRVDEEIAFPSSYDVGEIGPKGNTIQPWKELATPGRGKGKLTFDPANQSPANQVPFGVFNDDEWEAAAALGTQLAAMRLRSPALHQATSSLVSGFGSPSDQHGRCLPLIDPHGNMIWAGQFAGFFDDLDDPYETNLVDPSGFDNPFGLSDLEALCRADYPYEANRGRTTVAPNLASSRESYTTHSFSIPVAASVNGGYLRGTNQVGGRPGEGLRRSIREMFAARVSRVRGLPMGHPAAFAAAGELMAPDFERGEKLDLNRVLLPNVWPTGNGFMGSSSDLQRAEGVKLNAKAEFAEHLFHLMMLLSEVQINGAPTTNDQRILIRRIAQWAINVVDFGDADSVMTRFRYDINPFDDVTPLRGVDRLTRNEPPGKGMTWDEVWGMEHPELVLTETLAFHDRRAEDTDQEDNGRTLDNGDTDLDQATPPQGSAFFELQCVRGQNPVEPGWSHIAGRQPEDLYVHTAGQQPVLDIGKRIGAKPVWRLAISEIQGEDDDTPEDLLARARRVQRLASTFEPDELGLDLRRFVWFCESGPRDPRFPIVPPGEETTQNTYFNNTFSPEPGGGTPLRAQSPHNQLNTLFAQGKVDFLVHPGDFLLVGPRAITPVGLETSGMVHSPQEIILANRQGNNISNGMALHTRIDGRPLRTQVDARTRQQQILPSDRVVPLIAQTQEFEYTPGSPTSAYRAGVSVSEPTAGGTWYYRPPSTTTPPPPAGGRLVAPGYGTVEGTPMDDQPPVGNDSERAPLFRGADADADDDPNGTQENFRTVFLQRLADPNRPWDPVLNPYRTLDWMPIDLTVFNSLEPAGAGGNNFRQFASREKWGFPFSPSDKFNIWSASFQLTRRSRFDDLAIDPVQANRLESAAEQNVPHSLGWLNRGFDVLEPESLRQDGVGHFRPGITQPIGGTPRPTNDLYSEAPLDRPDPIRNPAKLDSYRTHPTLVWHNRPYANPYELLLVPASSSARLPVEYTTTPANNQQRNERGLFGHTLDFLQSSGPGTARSTNFHRVFDFVEVPSPFRGTEKLVKRDLLRQNVPVPGDNPYWTSTVNQSTRVAATLNPATIPAFREPGRVNLSTASGDVRQRVGFNSSLQSTGSKINLRHLDFERSVTRRKIIEVDSPATASVQQISIDGSFPDGTHPSSTANPLRAGIVGDLVPRWPGESPLADKEATLLRSRPSATGNVMATALPLLSGNYTPTSQTDRTLFKLQNPEANAYFQYKDLIKVGNSVTSQSNVYAVWITIGYFEMEPNVGPAGELFFVDAAHPDGYTLGIEMGSDIGSVTRHRSFYIVDRSIPVAFEPGVNHNVDDAVLVRRHIE